MENKRWLIMVKKFMLFGVVLLLFVACHNNVEFTRIVEGYLDRNGRVYFETILVKNIPKNKLSQSKMMIAYYDSVGLSIDYLKAEMPDKVYIMSFEKLTRATKKYYINREKKQFWDGNKTDLGFVGIKRCEDDMTKWQVTVNRNLGTALDYKHNGPDIETVVLSNPCEPLHPYWATENKELENYYKELRNKHRQP